MDCVRLPKRRLFAKVGQHGAHGCCAPAVKRLRNTRNYKGRPAQGRKSRNARGPETLSQLVVTLSRSSRPSARPTESLGRAVSQPRARSLPWRPFPPFNPTSIPRQWAPALASVFPSPPDSRPALVHMSAARSPRLSMPRALLHLGTPGHLHRSCGSPHPPSTWGRDQPSAPRAQAFVPRPRPPRLERPAVCQGRTKSPDLGPTAFRVVSLARRRSATEQALPLAGPKIWAG